MIFLAKLDNLLLSRIIPIIYHVRPVITTTDRANTISAMLCDKAPLLMEGKGILLGIVLVLCKTPYLYMMDHSNR